MNNLKYTIFVAYVCFTITTLLSGGTPYQLGVLCMLNVIAINTIKELK